jgi:hypothetical protein
VEPLVDDTGVAVRPPRPVGRVVSLVPSLTETLAVSAPGLLVGATDWCSHPVGLDVARVRGTKNPDLGAVLALRPDLVVANAEENRAADLNALRTAGLAVWVGVVESLDDAFGSLARMLSACGVDRPAWLDEAVRVWAAPEEGPRRRAAVPIWRRPWMVAAADTFASDLLARLGVDNVFGPGGAPELRYPRTTVEEVRARGADLVVLPDEPYAFSAADGPEAFAGLDVALVSGRHLTWYGPSLGEARAVLSAQLGAATRTP